MMFPKKSYWSTGVGGNMKKQNLWVIKDPKGRFVWDTISNYRSTCIYALEGGLGGEPFRVRADSFREEDETRDVYWKRLYRQGYRVEKFVATEVNANHGLRGWLIE
jgi:hypothetical protein